MKKDIHSEHFPVKKQPKMNSSEKSDTHHEQTSPEKAVALNYDGEQAPKVVAVGEKLVAEEIIRIAEQHDIYIHEDPILVDVLSQLELNDHIPETLYLATAKIIAFAYMLQEKVPEHF